jgi:ABC-type microcin C transport system permease subunit YejB
MENNNNLSKFKILIKRIIKVSFKIVLWSALLAVILIIAFLSYCSWLAYEPLMTEKFDRVIWKQSSVKYGRHYPIEKRCGMYHDLTRTI